ncbi:MAG: aminoacyl-tRNA hydrolase, partial [Deltaproteobacteria bacterium]|nr:aminoacyl-tRNA hydrolase [Deltaproteobacteria bacterium]
MKLVVGLGNPGRAYRWTRHNMGFWLIEQLAEQEKIEFSRRGLNSIYGRGRVGREEVIFAKPQTFMNRSGEAVSQLLRFFKIPLQEVIVLQDDLDLPPGKIRIRLSGGPGGHNGIKSIIDALGHNRFLRVKVGIGRPIRENQDPADYVLQPLTAVEKRDFKEAAERGAEAVIVLLRDGPEKAMDLFHRD